MAKQTDMTDLGIAAEVLEVTNAFRGKRFCITGHLGLTRPRVKAIIEIAGGSVVDRARDASYLVTNRDWTRGTVKGSKSEKLREAERFGVKILSEKEFYDMLIASGETAADVREAMGKL